MKGGQRRDTYSLAQENLNYGYAYCIWKVWKKERLWKQYLFLLSLWRYILFRATSDCFFYWDTLTKRRLQAYGKYLLTDTNWDVWRLVRKPYKNLIHVIESIWLRWSFQIPRSITYFVHVLNFTTPKQYCVMNVPGAR